MYRIWTTVGIITVTADTQIQAREIALNAGYIVCYISGRDSNW